MARYYFHTSDGSRELDDLGLELADDDAARREAVRYSGGLLCDDPDIVRNDHGLRIDVTNEAGHLCFAVIVNAVDTRWQG